MEILSSNIQMKSNHFYTESYQQTLKVNYWVDDQRHTLENQQALHSNTALIVQISDEALITQQTNKKAISFEPSEKDKLKIQLIEKFIENLTGKKFKINLKEITLKAQNSSFEILTNTENVSPSNGWGFELDYSEKYSEKETLSFRTEGIIKTKDGQEIKFFLKLEMNRSFIEETNLNIRAGDALKKDPLTINYNGNAVNLSNTRFTFDLDSDGVMDNIFFPHKGSGFLAFDINEDGKINNGGELFGPSSGDGFNDLAKYDEDKNGWIDQNDSIYSKLKIWSREDKGHDSLLSLEDHGIEAIYLGKLNTPFSLKDSRNELKAEIISTSIFISRDKGVGTVQQVNLTV